MPYDEQLATPLEGFLDKLPSSYRSDEDFCRRYFDHLSWLIQARGWDAASIYRACLHPLVEDLGEFPEAHQVARLNTYLRSVYVPAVAVANEMAQRGDCP